MSDKPSIPALLAEVDRAFTRRHRLRCRSQFGHEVRRQQGGRDYRVVKDEAGRISLFIDGCALSELDPGQVTKQDQVQLQDALGNAQVEDRLSVVIAQRRFELQLWSDEEGERECYAHLPGLIVALALEDDEGEEGLPRAQELLLRRYLKLLGRRSKPLGRQLRRVNGQRPAEIQHLDMVLAGTFSDQNGPVGLELKAMLGLGCNQDCMFCCARDPHTQFPLPELQRLVTRSIEQVTERSPDVPVTLALSGGEPTIYPQFGALLDWLPSLRQQFSGIQTIVLQTNGVKLADAALAERILAAGITAITFSLHAAEESLYDQLVGRRGQFPKVLQALGQVGKLPFSHLTYNIVINRLNHAHLPDYADFVAALPRHAVTEANILASTVYMDRDNGRWNELAIRHSDLISPLAAAAEGHPGLFGRMQGDCCMPPCVGQERAILKELWPVERMESPTTYFAERQPAADQVPWLQRMKHEDCHRCPQDPVCGGVCGEYVRSFGLGELRWSPA